MQRSALRTLLLAVLCLSVLALAAATLDTTRTDGSGFGTGGGGGDRGDGGPTPQPQQPRDPGTAEESSEDERYELCAPWVKEPPVIVAVILAAILTFLALLRWYDEFVAVAGTLIVFGPITLLMLVAAECGLETPDPNLSPNVTGGNGSSGGGSAGGGSGVPDPSLPLIALVAIGVLIALVAVAYYLTGDDTGGAADEESEDADAEDDPAVDATDVAEVGRLAGEAADRIEGADDFENQVYRAWREMTRPLNVDRPQSSSPGEFARAAAAAGMDRGSVDRLTELFDEVRYGGFEATPEREREAVSLLRSIEEQYADVETPADLADAADDETSGADATDDGGTDADPDGADGPEGTDG